MLPRHEHCSRDSEHEVTVTFASMEAGRGSPFPQYFYFSFPSSSSGRGKGGEEAAGRTRGAEHND